MTVATDLVYSNFSNITFRTAVMGVARNMPTMPQTRPKKTRDMRMVMGWRSREWPMILGWMMLPMVN